MFEHNDSSGAYYIDLAQRHLSYGSIHEAIDALKQGLASEPHNGLLHSYLALVLVRLKRLTAALHEARIGLQFEPDSAFAHYAIGYALTMRGKLTDGMKHYDVAVSIEPENVTYLLAQSHNLSLRKDHKGALAVVNTALSLAPEDCDVLSEYADILRETKRVKEAEAVYQQALAIEPQHVDALIGSGYLLLQKGELELARDHAVWVLHQQPGSEQALMLMASIKAKSNPLMGMWWRMNSWLVSGGNVRSIVLLVFAYVLFQSASIMLEDMGHKPFGDLVSYLWLGIVIYSWVGPVWFNKLLQKELQTVTLRKDF